MEYICSECKKRGSEAKDYRRLIGNIEIPHHGGLYGPNIFYKENVNDKKGEERTTHTLHLNSDDNTLRVYYNDFCVDCFRIVMNRFCRNI
jgi:hypothetical protein